jgi:hypothetical protein
MTNLFSPIPRFYIRDVTTVKCAHCSSTQTSITFQGSFPQFDDHGRVKTNSWQTRPLNGNDPIYAGIEIKDHQSYPSTPICPDCEDTYTRPTPPAVNYAEVLFKHDPAKAKKIIADANERLTRNYASGGKTIVRHPARKSEPSKPTKPVPSIVDLLKSLKQ